MRKDVKIDLMEIFFWIRNNKNLLKGILSVITCFLKGNQNCCLKNCRF
jgi:hypothetical protein